MSTGERFSSYSGLILTGFRTTSYRHDSMSYFGRENLWNDMSVFPQMVRRQVDMVVEEIGVELVDDVLHSPSRCNGCSLQVPESSHSRLATGEVSTGIADAFSRLCSFSQHFCSSLFKVFLYRLSAKLCEPGREFVFSLRLVLLYAGVSAQEFQETDVSWWF
ncbi:hypothetical protein RB195_001840 [Necator americanus]|uniref:Uncharacterized protein n=1 Tax=Necator americanus TaxID=51031 RepID=A0ABR1DG59_NECAM